MKRKVFIGIDPGKTGAIAIEIIGKPAIVYDYGDPEIKNYLSSIMREERLRTSVIAYIEDVHSMPKQGVKSMFTFGENKGWWRGFLDGLGIPYILVSSQKWQSIIRKICGNTDYEKVINRLYPDIITRTHRGRLLHDRIDALLIMLTGKLLQ